MITSLYTIKSFICIGDSLPQCYNCDYCRAHDNEEYHFHTMPSSINPLFSNLPVAVNLFYGDPTLQWKNTLDLLKKLEESHHKGIVMIVTKGKLKDIPEMELNLHVGISYGPDKISQDNLEYNIIKASRSWYTYSIEYRPICKGLNDSQKAISYVMKLARKYGNAPISYCGLQMPPFPLPDKYKPYDGREFSGQKYISKGVNRRIQKYAAKYNVPIFHKTSCMLSYMYNLSHDYNIHFLKPLGTECSSCVKKNECQKPYTTNISLPFKYEIIHRHDYQCSFAKNGLCKVPNAECMQMSGVFIKPQLKEITRGDARIIKWLTGYMPCDVENLVETPYISDFWHQ